MIILVIKDNLQAYIEIARIVCDGDEKLYRRHQIVFLIHKTILMHIKSDMKIVV